jgi:S-DNA-T family DNA segregation ATPase FtsK/SpoIIIE
MARKVAAAHDAVPVEIFGGFDDPRWQTWTPPPEPQAVVIQANPNDPPATGLRVGAREGAGFKTTLQVPFLGANHSFLIRHGAEMDKAAHGLLQALVLRIAAQFPRQVRFTLLDPVGYGRSFPMAKSLPAIRETGDDVGNDVRAVLQDVRRLMKDVIGFHERFDRLPDEIQASERYEIIVAADFPKARAYDRRCIEALAELARVGPQAGRYLFLHWPTDAPLPREAQDVTFDNCLSLDLELPDLILDAPPEPALAQKILAAIRETNSAARPAAGVDRLLPAEDVWWTQSSAEALVAPVGGAGTDLTLRFDGSLRSHALVSAAAGGGKSNLLHALILGLASRYGPDELELYLVDLKEGVEFNAYGRLPHAAVVSLNTEPALARAVVGDLCTELQRRLELFNAARVQNLDAYRKAGSPGGTLPRILLIVDEYQELFRDASDDQVSDDLRLLATQGRAPGVHMVLASQSASAPPGMLHARQIMDNVLTRAVLRLRPDAIAGLTDFGPAGREMIRSCDQPGKVVINDQGGQDGGNRLGQVVFVEATARDAAVRRMEELARKRGLIGQPQLFNGKESPSVAENPVVRNALAAPRGPDTQALGALARTRWVDGGFDRADWRGADRPIPLWIGRQRHIHGHATVLLGRRDGAHLLIVGGAAEGARGMTTGVLASLAAAADPAAVTVELLVPGEPDPLLQDFKTLAAARGLELGEHTTPAAVTQRLIDLAATLDAVPNSTAKSRVLLLFDPDDDPDLRRPADPTSRDRSPALAALRRILADGPRFGLHLVLVVRSPRALTTVLDDRRGDLRTIRWRAAVKMSEDDSRRLFDQASAAARLDPRAAVLQDLENATLESFLPYRPELPITS